MINALKGLGHNQFEWARYSPKIYTQYKFIQVSVVSENESRWSTVIQNLRTSADSTIIRTSYAHDYKVGQHIMYRGRWYEITAETTVTQDIAPQTLGLVRGGAKQYILELTESNGYDAV